MTGYFSWRGWRPTIDRTCGVIVVFALALLLLYFIQW